MKTKLLTIAAALSMAIPAAEACTRITFVDDNGAVLTGRTMDWSVADNVSVRVYPRNVEHSSLSPVNPLTWTSKYGSVIAVSFGKSLNSGMNEKGLAVDTLWLEASDYGTPANDVKTLTGNDFTLFVLDSFATVDEAVRYFEKGEVAITQDKVPNTDIDLKLHFMITDKTGDNAIFEYIDGKLQVYRMKGAAAMTNDPAYDKMKAVEQLYRDRGLVKNMPGSSHAVDRYLRAAGWLEQVTADAKIAPQKVSADFKVLSIMRAVSTPLGLSDKENPQNCSTLWRAVSDLENGVFTIDSSFEKTIYSVRLADLDFTGSVKEVVIHDANNPDSQNLLRHFKTIR